MRLLFFGRSAAQARAIDHWWREHRPDAPGLFAAELTGTVRLLSTAPELGMPYGIDRVRGVRRLVLPRTQHHLYYAHDRERHLLGLLAIWSCKRGRVPSIKFFKGFP